MDQRIHQNREATCAIIGTDATRWSGTFRRILQIWLRFLGWKRCQMMPETQKKCPWWIHGTGISLRIQVCPKKWINPTIVLWGWDWDHQTYCREGYGSLGYLMNGFKFMAAVGKSSSPMDPSWDGENVWKGENRNVWLEINIGFSNVFWRCDVNP